MQFADPVAPLAAQPTVLKNLRLPSRLVRSATAEHIPVGDEASAQELGALYRRIGEGGAGLVITGHVAVHPSGRTGPRQPGLFTTQQAEAWRLVFEEAHKALAKVLVQINHAGGYAPVDMAGGPRWCVSSVPHGKPAMPGPEMSEKQIKALMAAFARAASSAIDAGADGIQIHAAHGYVVSQFLSPLTNRRRDHWGGDLSGRARFLIETARAVRASVGTHVPVGVKLGAADGDPAGLRLDDTLQVAAWLQEDPGIDFVEVSGAFHPDVIRRRISHPDSEAYYLEWARTFRKALRIPVIAVGGFRSPAIIENALQSGACDLVSASRPFIREPDFPKRIFAGETSQCESCNRCLVSTDGSLRCRRLSTPPA